MDPQQSTPESTPQINTSPIPVQPNTVSNTQKPRFNSVLFYIVLFIVGVGAGYVLTSYQIPALVQSYIQQNLSGGQAMPTGYNRQIPDRAPTATPTPDPTAGWKTYESMNGYSLKYPAETFMHIICPNEDFDLSMRVSGDNRNDISGDSCARDMRYPLEITINPTETNIQSDEFFTITKQDVMVDGILAKSYVAKQIKAQNAPGESWYRIVFISVNGKTYGIRFNKEELNSVFDQILSTFKFLNTSSPTPDPTAAWKTYDDSSARITFRYPSDWIEGAPQMQASGNSIEIKDSNNVYTLMFQMRGNYNNGTGKAYTNIDEFVGMPYTVQHRIVAGLDAAQMLPRAGSESNFLVAFISKDLKSIISIELDTPRDGSHTAEGKKLFDQILSTFKFLN